MNANTVLTVAFIGAAAFGGLGLALAAYLVRRGWTLGKPTTWLPLRH